MHHHFASTARVVREELKWAKPTVSDLSSELRWWMLSHESTEMFGSECQIHTAYLKTMVIDVLLECVYIMFNFSFVWKFHVPPSAALSQWQAVGGQTQSLGNRPTCSPLLTKRCTITLHPQRGSSEKNLMKYKLQIRTVGVLFYITFERVTIRWVFRAKYLTEPSPRWRHSLHYLA